MAGYTELPRLLDRRRVRALVRTLRAEVDALGRDHETDPSLVERLDRPFETVAETHRRLAALEARLRAAGDRRAVFLTIYVRMTEAMQAGIERGRFADAAWMRRYTVTFADYYRRAFLAFERGDLGAVPDPWRVAFGTAVEETGLVVQDAFLGINAHINYDLALTLHEVGIDPDRVRKRADHEGVDDVLSGLVDAQQDALVALYAPGLATVDDSLYRLDELLSLTTMTEGRAQAWRLAVVLTDVGWRPARAYARWVLRATATGGALFVRSPSVDPELLRALERVEREQVSLDDALALLDDHLDPAGR